AWTLPSAFTSAGTRSFGAGAASPGAGAASPWRPPWCAGPRPLHPASAHALHDTVPTRVIASRVFASARHHLGPPSPAAFGDRTPTTGSGGARGRSVRLR